MSHTHTQSVFLYINSFCAWTVLKPWCFVMSGSWFKRPWIKSDCNDVKLLCLTPLALVELLAHSKQQTEWMKSRRGPSAGKAAMRGHGETFNKVTLNLRFVVHFRCEICCVWPAGRCWKRTSLAHSKPQWKRSFSSPKGKGVCVNELWLIILTIRFNNNTMCITIHGWWYDTRMTWAHLEWDVMIQFSDQKLIW